MKKSEIAVIFNDICGIKFPFFENNFKLSSDRKQIDERREIITKAKTYFKEWQKQYEDYLTDGNNTIKNTKVDKASQLINAYNKARIEDDKAVIINILDQWFKSLVFAGQSVNKNSEKHNKKKLWKEYNDGKWINEDIANMLNDCFESITYYR